jgi:hypothetical protein
VGKPGNIDSEEAGWAGPAPNWFIRLVGSSIEPQRQRLQRCMEIMIIRKIPQKVSPFKIFAKIIIFFIF